MSLLNESKKAWLLSFVICTIIPCALWLFAWENDITKTMGIMFFEAQAIVAIFFFVIIIFKVKKHFLKILALVLYLGCIIYGCASGVLHKWYIIILIFIVSGFYMLWNLGGVINCVIADWYKKQINTSVSYATTAYNNYATLLHEYNESFSENIRKAKEPDWDIYAFYSDGMDRFIFKHTIIGESDLWKRWGEKLEKLFDILSDLAEKVNTITEHMSVLQEEYKELNDITEISSQTKKAKSDIKKAKKWSKKIIKKHQKLLKKTLEK